MVQIPDLHVGQLVEAAARRRSRDGRRLAPNTEQIGRLVEAAARRCCRDGRWLAQKTEKIRVRHFAGEKCQLRFVYTGRGAGWGSYVRTWPVYIIPTIHPGPHIITELRG